MINLEKIKEEMIEKNEFFKIKNGSDVMFIPNPEFQDEYMEKGEKYPSFTSQKDITFHPSWLIGIHECSECPCEPSYNFKHQFEHIKQIVVNESDVVRVSGGVK